MEWVSITSAIGSVATAGGMVVTAYQVFFIRQQARTQFEDGLTNQYREIMERIPVKALLGHRLSDVEREQSLSAFYHYFDLCDEQLFLHSRNRVCDKTWRNWEKGIWSHFQLTAFKEAWAEIVGTENSKSRENFKELAEFFERLPARMNSKFTSDASQSKASEATQHQMIKTTQKETEIIAHQITRT